jgi:hypothetical protein
MKNTLAKYLIGSTLAVATLAAQAGTYIDTGAPNADGTAASNGQAILKFSKNSITAFNSAGYVWVTSPDLAHTVLTTDAGPLHLREISATMPWQSTVMNVPGNFQSLQFGGTMYFESYEDTWTVKPGGGWLTFSHVRLDLPTGIVYADVTGANGLGKTPQNVAMWTFGAVNQAVTGDSNVTIPQLSLMLTDAGADVFIKGLNFNETVGAPAIKWAQNNGAFATLDASLVMRSPLQAIPEASTYSMMLLGLAGVMGVSRSARSRRGVISASVRQDRTSAIP